MSSGAVVSEQELRRRQLASQREFFCTVASGSAGARLVRRAGVQATVVPVRPWFGFFNSVFYDDAQALEHSLETLAREYAEAGVKAWTVWVPPGEHEAGAMLERAGHVRDSSPLLMAAPISAIDLGSHEPTERVAEPTWDEVARCNDRAHGVPEHWSMAAVFEQAEDPACHLYALARDGEVASALVAREQDRDCYFWFVATDPRAQREGLASRLMRHALRRASERGCTSATLESTPAGQAVYARLGFRALGRFAIWERRSD